MGKTALILGSTGLTGSFVLQELIDDTRYCKIVLISRRSSKLEHSKIEEHIIDMSQLNEYPNLFRVNEVFCCIGTTKAKTPDRSIYRTVDFDLPVKAAELSKMNAVPTFVVISSMGANSKSSIFYSRLKGEMEEAIINLRLLKTIIVRPSLIAGPRMEKRKGEQFAKILMKVLNPLLIGKLKVYRAIEPITIARAMIRLANEPTKKVVYASDELIEIANGC